MNIARRTRLDEERAKKGPGLAGACSSYSHFRGFASSGKPGGTIGPARAGARGGAGQGAAPRLRLQALYSRRRKFLLLRGSSGGRPTRHPSQLFGKEQVIALVMFSIVGPYLHGCERPLPWRL